MSSERETIKTAFLAEHGLAGARREPLAGDASTRLYERLHRADGGSLIFMDQPPSAETAPCPPDATPAERVALGYNASARLAAASLGEALSGDGFAALLRYEERLEEAYGLYYRVARAFIRVIANPELMKLCVGTGMYSGTLMSWILRIMSNLVRPDETGPAEAAYRALAAIARLAPEGV